MKITIQAINDKQQWETYIGKRKEANFLQSWEWGDFHQALGKEVLRMGLYRSGELSGVFLIIIENAKRARYMTIAGGPLLPVSWGRREVVVPLLGSLRDLAKKHNCSFVRIRPQEIYSAALATAMTQYGLRPSPMHLSADLTNQLDLSLSEDELLSSMRKNTRYEVRRATKLGVRVESSTNPSDIDEFYNMQLTTARRHGFVPFAHAFLKKQFETFVGTGSALLYKAYFKDQLLAEAFIIYYGHEAVYHYGASTDAGRKYPGAYLIQWEAIREAKRRGCDRYNFWGVVPLERKDHRFWGVSIFKRGFGGREVQYLAAHDLIVDPARYALNAIVETVRRKTRHLD